jgi:hypothetical protein
VTEGLTCTRRCTTSFPAGEAFDFRARAAKRWRFTAWSGYCHGKRPTCHVPITATRQIGATFRRVKRPR